MSMVLTVVQIVIAVLLILAILLQMQGSGLSTAFGGGGEFYRSRRSAEQFLLWGTVVLTLFFGVVSILLLLPH